MSPPRNRWTFLWKKRWRYLYYCFHQSSLFLVTIIVGRMSLLGLYVYCVLYLAGSFCIVSALLDHHLVIPPFLGVGGHSVPLLRILNYARWNMTLARWSSKSRLLFSWDLTTNVMMKESLTTNQPWVYQPPIQQWQSDSTPDTAVEITLPLIQQWKADWPATAASALGRMFYTYISGYIRAYSYAYTYLICMYVYVDMYM